MEPSPAYLAQGSYRCRFDWGPDGVRRAAGRNDIVVVVDVLRFSTAAIAAVQGGAAIYPCAPGEDIALLAECVGAEIAAYHRAMLATHRYSLSPASYDNVPPGARIVLPSPNGAACCNQGWDAPYLLVGALVNAAAAGEAATSVARRTGLAVTVIACGERWPATEDSASIRVALEDYLGAGAILAHIPLDKSPEARVGELSFRSAQGHLRELLLNSTSGRELCEKGWEADVARAAQLDTCGAVPVLRGDHLGPFRLSDP